MIAALFMLVACNGGGTVLIPAPSSRIVLNAASPRPTIEVVDVPPDQLRAIEGTQSREAWTAILTVQAAVDQPPAVGQYTVEDGRIRFTPMFPLDAGRQYRVTFTPPGGEAVSATVGLPPPDTTPKTGVTQVFPSGEVVPANQLRLYIRFSAPMGLRGAAVHLLDETGHEMSGPFLPLEAEFWNEDRTLHTVFFDPRRPITAGKSYTFVIDSTWLDGEGLPLKQPFRRTFTAGPPDHRPLDPKTWKIDVPAAGSSTPLTIAFPEPLDYGLLLRALSVATPRGQLVDGQAVVGGNELTWTFTPADPWKAGPLTVVVSGMLEDLAGNGIGRAFDPDRFDRTHNGSEFEKTVIPINVK